MKAVQFGAGSIGRGFLAQLFHEAGLEIVFIDVDPALVAAIEARRAYTIEIVGPRARTVRIDNIRAIEAGEQRAAADEIARAAIVSTAVGANALPLTAPALAQGLAARDVAGGGTLNVLICENLHDAAGVLRGALATELPESRRHPILASTGLVQAVVSRMVPLQAHNLDGDPLTMRTEAYMRLPVDAGAVAGVLPAIPGIELVQNFRAHVERKLYTHNCAHAVLGYVGFQGGYEFGFEALRDPRIASLVSAVLEETGAALIARHGFDPREHAQHIQDLFARFANEALGDTCRRLARDPLRKLAPDDRLVGSARLCEAEGIEPRAIAWAIAAALRYTDPADPSAVELQTLIRDVGIEMAMRRVCGIRPDELLAELVDEALFLQTSV